MKILNNLNNVMQQLVRDFNAGAVATINEDGTPAVSIKATFVVADSQTLAYGDIRSPGTRANLERHPAVEVVFTDVLARRALRVRGTASITDKNSEQGKMLMPHFKQHWQPYVEHMSCFVRISVTEAELVLTPAYDLGFSKAELVKTNLEKLTRIANE